MDKPRARRTLGMLLSALLALVLLVPADTTLAAASQDWYPSHGGATYHLHGHSQMYFVTVPAGYFIGSQSYTLTTNGYVWVGVYSEANDYCSSGGWGLQVQAGWHWHYNQPNVYHEAKTPTRQSRTCNGHKYATNGGHNIHVDGGVDFTGWTDAQ